jgi:hypothetical protein
MWICFPSIEPVQLGKFQRSRYLPAMHFNFDSFGGSMNRDCNVVHIGDVMSAIMPEIVLVPFIN